VPDVKRGGPLKRNTELRRTPLKRTTTTTKGRRMPTKTKSGRTEAELAAIERDGPNCQRCGKVLGAPEWRTSEWSEWSLHHRKLKGRGTPPREYDLVENLVVLCGSGTTGCHGWAHAERLKSHEDGWTCWTGDTPADRPLITLVGTMLMLLPDGTKLTDRVIDVSKGRPW
jgi:hypothetical protein